VRKRHLLAGLALAAVTVLGLAGPAFADEGPTTIKHSDDKQTQECIEKLAEGDKLGSCHEAPSPIVPPVNELVWGGISFAIVVFLLSKFAWPGLKKGLEDRTAKIAGDISAAESQRTEADQILADYKAQLADAKNESARIIEEARQSADAMKKDQEQKLQAELAEMKAKSVADIEAAKVQAVADLRNEVTEIAIGAAERVVGKSLDRETSTQLVESFIAQVGAQN
jgi:F-type H+-transporting ATPase subunit b